MLATGSGKNHLRLIGPAFAGIVFIGLSGATVTESQSAGRKLESIEAGHLSPGARIRFTPGELNAWMLDEARNRAPEGVRNLRLELGNGQAACSGDVDFLKLRQASTGEAAGWLMKNLFSGERTVKVAAHFASANGRARVDIDRVEVSGVPIEGRTLGFLIDVYVRPTFPDVKVSEWFALQYRVERFTVSPAVVVVYIGR